MAMRRRTEDEQAGRDERVQILLRVPRKLHRALKHASVDREISLNEMLLRVVEDWWREQPEHGRY